MKLISLILASFAITIAAMHAADPAPVATITITLQLNQEQIDALTDYTTEWNGKNGASTVQDRILADVIQPWIKTRTDASYAAAVKNLGEAAKGLSYTERTALIQQVRAAIEAN